LRHIMVAMPYFCRFSHFKPSIKDLAAF